MIQQARPPVTLHATPHDGAATTDSSGVQLKEPGSADTVTGEEATWGPQRA